MKITKIKAQLSGIAPIMFDRFINHDKTPRPPDQKLYLADGNAVVLPSANIESFLFGNDPPGCARMMEGKKGKEAMRIGLGHVFVSPDLIPITSEKKPIIFDGFGKQIYTYTASGRTKSGSGSIKQEAKERPVIRMPWEVEFELSLVENPMIDETKLFNWFNAGGLLIALGTYRPKFGRFEVVDWEVV